MKVFITFGAGGQNFIDAGHRLIKQAEATGYFDKIILYTDVDLKNDTDFWSQHSEFILNNKRGYGYWLWKPYIIKKTMETMNEGDILMYLDCGCEIGGDKQLLIPNFFEYVQQDKIIGITTLVERDWCKMDLLIHLDMDKSELINIAQRCGGVVMYYICEKTKFIVDLWYETGCNYNLIDDSPSVSKNFDCFKEHRHDQAIFSLLLKKYNILSKRNLRECIHVVRNKTGKSILKQ